MKKILYILIPFVLIPLFIFSLLYFSKGDDKSRALYNVHCASCHMDNGEGLRGVIPPLEARYLSENAQKLPCIIRNGMAGEITVAGQPYNQPMPGNERLSDIEIANLINFIQKEFGKPTKPVSPQQVTEMLTRCE